MAPCTVYRTIINKNRTLICFSTKKLSIFAIQENECFYFPDKIVKGMIHFREGGKNSISGYDFIYTDKNDFKTVIENIDRKNAIIKRFLKRYL